ncbi:MAG: hypothetical protein KDA52_12070 [Planctomycetaceae bacterium]|nr:hypothetical protein [Planctomycetaceae bacterium]
MADDQKNDGISVHTMTIGVMLLVAYICWGIAASAYLDPLVELGPPPEGFRRGRGGGYAIKALLYWLVSFVGNSLRLNHVVGITSNVLRNDQWILLTFVVLEVLALGFGIWVKMLDTKLNPPRRKRKRPLTGPKVEKPQRRKREGI